MEPREVNVVNVKTASSYSRSAKGFALYVSVCTESQKLSKLRSFLKKRGFHRFCPLPTATDTPTAIANQSMLGLIAKIGGLLLCRVIPVAAAPPPPTQGTHLPEASSTSMRGQKALLLLLLHRCDMTILLAAVDRRSRPMMSHCTGCRKKEGIAFSQEKR